jgi:hypothetical protein
VALGVLVRGDRGEHLRARGRDPGHRTRTPKAEYMIVRNYAGVAVVVFIALAIVVFVVGS